MKRTLSFMVMALALLFTQCRKPEEKFPSPVAPEGVTVRMTVTTGPGGRTDISAAGGITWSANDKLYVGDGEKCVGVLTLQSGVGSATATFSGDVTVTEGGHTFHFYYLGSATSVDINATEATVDFSSQDIYADGGKLNDAGKYHVGYGKVDNVDVNGDTPITGIQVGMKSKVAIAYFRFKSGTGSTYTGALTLSGSHIYNKMRVNFNSTGFDCEGIKGDISLAGGHAERYVMLVPTSSTTGSQTLYFGDGDVTGCTKLENGIEANKFYRMPSDNSAIVVTVTPKPIETVNFGTPDLNWSKYNLGVDPAKLTNAWDWYGDYYAWGEVVPYYTSLTWTSATTCTVNGWNTEATLGGGGTVDASKGYAWQSYSHGSTGFKEWNESPCTGSVPYDSDNKLLPARDAATQAWGEGWRMPTQEEWKSLYDNNTFEWLAADAASENVPTFTAPCAGRLVVKGKGYGIDSEVYMFLPAAGGCGGTSLDEADSEGYYWSSTLFATGSTPIAAPLLYFASGYVHLNLGFQRFSGFCVRPVRASR